MSASNLVDSIGRDTHQAIRGLSRHRSFALVALLTLALGIGGTTAVFSILNSVLLRPLPYPNADELVAVWHDAPGATGLVDISGGLRASPSMFWTYEEHNRTFQNIGLWFAGTTSVTGVAEPEEVRSVFVTDGTLQALSVPPTLGRWLDATDQLGTPTTEGIVLGGPTTAVLGYAYWQRRFGGDPSVIGRTVTVNGNQTEIVGVMPEGFRIANADLDLILPFRFNRSAATLPPFCCQAIARLKPETSIADANGDVARMLQIWYDAWPYRGDARETYERGWRIAPALRPLHSDVVGTVGNALWVVMGMVAVVLLIACANVTNLLLARGEGRQRELAVRTALGAGTARIARGLMLESMVLGLIGGALGLLVAQGAVQLLQALGPANLPRLDEVSLDAWSLVFTLLVALLSGLALGWIPAWKYSGPRVTAALQSGARGASGGRERHRTQNVLVVTQVALALVLLVSSGLMIRTFQALHSVEPGFTESEHVQTIRIGIPLLLEREPERVIRIQNDIVDAIAAIPSVTAVGFTSSMPLEGIYGNWDDIDVENEPVAAGVTPPLRKFTSVSPGLFRTLGTRLVAGRDVTWTDVHEKRPVAMISENLARELWDEPAAALGKRIRSAPDTPWRDVVGVLQDVRDNGVDQPAPTIVYWPSYMANFFTGVPAYIERNVTIAIRSDLAGTPALVQQIQQAVWSVSSSLPIASVRTLRDMLDRSLARQSLTLVMLATAGTLALTLGVVGIYGVLSYAVAQRRREIAIRMALGAQQRAVTRTFVRHGVLLSGVGVAFGLVAAAGVSRLMSSLLFEVRPIDLPTYAAVALLLTLVAAIASYLPARRAATVDPAEALTAE
jgi:predicted permease